MAVDVLLAEKSLVGCRLLSVLILPTFKQVVLSGRVLRTDLRRVRLELVALAFHLRLAGTASIGFREVSILRYSNIEEKKLLSDG